MRCRPFSGHFLYCLTIGQPDWIWNFARTLRLRPGCVAAFCAMLYMGFRATLSFRISKVALNPMYRLFFKTLPKFESYLAYQNSIKRKKNTKPCLKYKHLKLKLRVFLAGQSFALVMYCLTKMLPTFSPVIGQFFDTMIVAFIDKSWLSWTIKIYVFKSAGNCFEPPKATFFLNSGFLFIKRVQGEKPQSEQPVARSPKSQAKMYPRPKIHRRIQGKNLIFHWFQLSSQTIAALRATPSGSSCPQWNDKSMADIRVHFIHNTATIKSHINP